MDVSVEIHCDKCGSANLSLPPPDQVTSAIACNDCGADHGSLDSLHQELIDCARRQSAEVLREGISRIA
jgi:DNA-directed RNA polymerase subunit RPC12/RpoP